MNYCRDAVFLENPTPQLIFSQENRKVICVNKTFEEQYCRSSHIVGKSLSEFSHPSCIQTGPGDGESYPKKQYVKLDIPDSDIPENTEVSFTYNKISDNGDTFFLATVKQESVSELDLKEKQPVYQAVFEKALDIILVADNSGNFVEVNKTACEKLGYSREELLDTSVADITFSPMKSYGNKKWDDFLRTGTDEGEYLLQTKDGSVLHTEYRAIANIRPGEHLSILRDVSEQKRIEEALSESETRFKRLLEAAPDAVLVVDKKGRILFSNSRVEDMMGYDRNELVGKPVEVLVPDAISPRHRQYHQKYNENPQQRPMGSGLDLKAVRKDGSQIPVDIMLGPIRENGSLQTLAIVRDVSDYKEAQEKLKAEKDFTTLLHHLTKIANEDYDLDDALSRSIRHICEFMDWPVGHAYLPEENTGKFYPADIWYLEDPEEFREFRELTMNTKFQPGEGMIGEIMETGRPQWREDVHRDPTFVRRSDEKDYKVRASFAFPLIVRNKVMGILEFFTTGVMPKNKAILEKMATVGHQLGRVQERQKAENRLKTSEQKFKKLFDSARDAIFILGKEGVVDCNRSAQDLFQSSCDELKNKSLKSFFPETQPDGTSQEAGLEKVNKVFEGEDQYFEWQFLRPDGSLVDTEVSLINIPMESGNFVQAVIHDITERKEKDRLLRKNMKLFSQLFRNSPIGLVNLDKRHRVRDINGSFHKIFGYALGDIKNKKIDDFFAPDDLYDDAEDITRRTLEGEIMQLESVRLHKDGNRIPVLIATVPVEIDGEIVAIFGMYVDISQRKETQKKLEQQLEEKKVLLSEIHHRVKNNMAIISGLLELQKDNTQNRDAFEKMKDSQARIQSMALIHEQLYQKELFASVRFDEYVRNLGTTIANSFNRHDSDITISYETEVVELNMEQAIPCGLLLNELVTNAFKHAFPDREKGEIMIRVARDESRVILEVSDDGVGIPADFEKLQDQSLGMQLIQTLTNQLMGDFKVSSSNGSTFRLTFEISDIRSNVNS